MSKRYSNEATKVPNTLRLKRAIRARGYAFVEEGDAIIIQESLSRAEVKALLIESQRPHEAESSTQHSIHNLAERAFIDVEEQGPVPDFLGHPLPIQNSFDGDYFGRSGAKDSFMRSWVNQVLVSDVHGLNLHEKQAHVIYSTRGSSEAYRAWFNPTLWLEGQATRADLFDIGYAEYYQDFARSHSFTLNSLGYRGRPKRDVKFRWIKHFIKLPNARGELPAFGSDFLARLYPLTRVFYHQNLVTECPFISKSLRSVALKVLLEASQQFSKPDASKSQIDAGTVIRYIGRHRVHSACIDTGTQDTQPVVFVSTPYLLMAQKPPAAPVSRETRKRNLIEFLYGSESGSFRQPWPKHSTANGFKHSISDMLEVPEASFLLIGSDILISISRMPWRHMISSTITVNREDETNTCRHYTIQIIDETGTRRTDLVIEKECSHESFVHQAFGLPRNVRLSLGSYILVDEHERLVNHSVWHDYLKSGEVERHAFQLKEIPSLFPAEHMKSLSTCASESNEASTDVSNHATALEPSHTRIYKNELSFSISNDVAEVYTHLLKMRVTSILDDPCSSWICLKHWEPEPDPYPYDPGHWFYGDLMKIRDKAQDVHASMTGEETQVEVSLIHCFEYIICKFLLAAEEASLINRSRLRSFETGILQSANEEVSVIRGKIKEINQKIHEQLDLATRDIMMSGTTRGDNDQLIVSDIGPEFLLANLISNLQNHTIMHQTGKTLDIIQYYRRVSSSLQYTAVRDPRKRRFLEISALEEETDALRAVIEIQIRMVKAFKKILSPDFFRHETTDDEYLGKRSRRHMLEREHLERHLQKLSESIRTLETLLGIAQVTKYKMKQVLEVLDEGHGKAIRVFTFVTLFFLPLSFVTSFFGMNTTDVREIGWDQRLFWSSAIPLTVAVISLALIYGYQWDTVLEFRDRVFKSHEPYQLHLILDQDVTSLTEETNAETGIPIRPSTSPKQSRLWVSGVERLRVGRWKKREADARQKLNESQV
ncbi:Mg2+ transporter [Fusarium mundagurra]|uniref:Mg2+ transporter n=1 Tax=Fusarium mundagurra TaxID=1567541 RepID=A0A8H5XYY3_9HYPO|nr:Mg2+ transporter [Fusarium mundagurra]